MLSNNLQDNKNSRLHRIQRVCRLPVDWDPAEINPEGKGARPRAVDPGAPGECRAPCAGKPSIIPAPWQNTS